MIDTETLSIANKKLLNLPQEIYDDLYGHRKAERKKDKEFSNFHMDYVLTDGEGNTYMLAEEFYMMTQYVSNGLNDRGYWVNTYHYDDVLIIKFNAKGNLDWGRSIFKRSMAPSYNIFIKNG